MTFLEWAALVTAYPFLVALIAVWMHAASPLRDPAPLTRAAESAVPRPTMKVEASGRQVARFEVLEHVAPDGEILEFHVPPAETKFDWTVDQVADLVAAIDRLPQAPELETL
jgi:hypothetical protein